MIKGVLDLMWPEGNINLGVPTWDRCSSIVAVNGVLNIAEDPTGLFVCCEAYLNQGWFGGHEGWQQWVRDRHADLVLNEPWKCVEGTLDLGVPAWCPHHFWIVNKEVRYEGYLGALSDVGQQYLKKNKIDIANLVRQKMAGRKAASAPDLTCADAIIIRHAMTQALSCLKEGFEGEAVEILTQALEDVA